MQRTVTAGMREGQFFDRKHCVLKDYEVKDTNGYG